MSIKNGDLKFEGVYTALITPFTKNREIDYEGLEKLIEFQIENNIDGIVPIDTTGETPALTEDEENDLIKFLVKKVNHRVPLIVGTGSNTTTSMLQYTQRAKNLGVDGALIVTPYYNKPNDSGLLEHFRLANDIGIPVIVYNIPGRTGRNIQTPLLQQIAKFSNIVGVKEASGDINQANEVIHKIKLEQNFTVFSGDDALTLPILSVGGDGVISVTSNIVPQKVKAMYDSFKNNQVDQAIEIHQELFDLTEAMFCEVNPVPVKYAMNLLGMPSGPTRRPLGELSDEHKKQVEAALKRLQLI